MRFIEQIKAKLAPKMAEHMRFEPGMTLEGLMIRVEIAEEASVPLGEIRTGGSVEADGTTLLRFVVAEGTAPEKYQRAVNRHILTRACAVAERFFWPYVLEAAARVGLRERVKSVSFNTNRSNYGLCYRDGRIEFSSRLLFYPAELRELVVMHELAHLTHPDHSEAFHALVNDYLGGRERELERKLRAFRTPLF